LLSGDGRFVAMRTAADNGLVQLYTVTLDGSNARPLANVAGNYDRLQWQPYVD
jgi:Tol biopolymer transport system component